MTSDPSVDTPPDPGPLAAGPLAAGPLAAGPLAAGPLAAGPLDAGAEAARAAAVAFGGGALPEPRPEMLARVLDGLRALPTPATDPGGDDAAGAAEALPLPRRSR